MILIGMFDSPFVRRVAVSMRLLGLDFEHRNWSIGQDFDLIRQYNPLGRVPTLVPDDGQALFESAAILDWLDEQVGPARALLPASAAERRRALKLIATATGAAEKAVLQLYEHAFRPAERRHPPWTDRCATQMHAGLAELDAACVGVDRFLVADRLTQADITATCVFSFASDALSLDPAAYPALRAHAARQEALTAFREIRAPFHAPG
ncbi:MAG: glutathione S-transferase [Nevskia sp.]|nr:glutathione S-transferase [Nevskia sp.]